MPAFRPWSLLLVAALSLPARAGVTFEFLLDNAFATDISADGSVLAGNLAGSYETFRWTAATGIQPLGMSTAVLLGGGAGSPDISADGSRISATIASADTVFMTVGIWSEATGWQQLAPPIPPDGGLVDLGLASGWGMSEDGNTLVGFYWRPCGRACGGSARGTAWTTSGYTVLDDGQITGSSRVNDTNADGTVSVGWKEHATGPWQSAVWRDGTMTVLADGINGTTGLECVTPDGSIIAGGSLEFSGGFWRRVAAYWTWNGSGWDEHVLGMLPFTSPVYGMAKVLATSADGSIMGGMHQYGFGDFVGWIWTAEEGMLKVEDWLAGRGVVFTEPFVIQGINAISDDGRILIGHGYNTAAPYMARTFRITIDNPTAAPEILASSMQLLSAYPNPFNPSTTLPLVLAAPTHVELALFDVQGRRVRLLHQGELMAGRHEFIWDGRDLSGQIVPSGVYFARAATATSQIASERLVLLK